jgi:hypothetical protein
MHRMQRRERQNLFTAARFPGIRVDRGNLQA